jgi:hypothetical protein
MRQHTLPELKDELSRLEEERINQLSSNINQIKVTFEVAKGRFEKYDSKKSINSFLKNIKNSADPMRLLLSAPTLEKHYSNLNRLSEISGISLENHEDSIFLQNFYGLFFKAPNGISKEKKEEILQNDELLKETVLFFKKLDDSQNLTKEDLKDAISIYKLKVENGENKAEMLIEKYKNSYLFKQNMKEVVATYKNAIESGKSFDFVNKNIVSLLTIWILKSNKQEFLDFINSDLNLEKFLEGKKGKARNRFRVLGLCKSSNSKSKR